MAVSFSTSACWALSKRVMSSLAKAKPIDAKPGRFKPGDRLLNFLKSL
jgi:hypothetical protein